jgi:glycosyltransferase involved in cell wall biosynthesis
MQQIRVAILTNILPNYREGFYQRLFSKSQLEVTVFCQDHIPGSSYKTIHEKFPTNVQIVPFRSWFNQAISWQFIPWRKLFREFDVWFVDGNPRILTHAVLATIGRLCGKRVVVWSMVHSYHNVRLTKCLRLTWLRLFKYHFLYNDSDIDSLREMGFKGCVMIAMNNGLDQVNIDQVAAQWTDEKLHSWQVEHGISDIPILLSSGRLLPGKYETMLRALPQLVKRHPQLLWIVVGDGEDRNPMEAWVTANGLSENVRFLGAIFEEEQLAPWFLSANLFVHPCAVGLSILHAFGYGLPFVTHANESTHGPEYVAFKNGETGANYDENDSQDLSDRVDELLLNPNKRSLMRQTTLAIARNKYNVDEMARRFVSMTEAAYGVTEYAVRN